MALTLHRSPGQPLANWPLAALRWILRSNLRMWTPLTLLLAWMILEITRSSLGDALVTLITVPPVLHAGVSRLRAKLGLDGRDE